MGFTVLNINEIDTASRCTLDWFDVVNSLEKIGKIFVAVEIIKVPDDLTETVNGLIMPLLNHVQPIKTSYQLILSKF